MAYLGNYLAEADVRGQTYDPGNTVSGTATTINSAANFGASVSLSDDGLTLAVGSPDYNACFLSANGGYSPTSGAFSVFTRSNVNAAWAPFGTPNNVYPAATYSSVYANAGAFASLNGAYYNIAEQGGSVALSGDGTTLVVGAPRMYLQNTGVQSITTYASTGAALVYTRASTSFVLAQVLQLPSSYGTFLGTGESVAVSPHGEVVLAGVTGLAPSGGVAAYVRNALGQYVLLYNQPLVAGTSLALGYSCAVTGVTAAGAVAFTIAAGAPEYGSQYEAIGAACLFAVPAADYRAIANSSSSTPPSATPPASTNFLCDSAQTISAVQAVIGTGTFPGNNFHIGNSLALSRDGSTLVLGSLNLNYTTNSSAPNYGLVLVYSTSNAQTPTNVFAQPNYTTSAAANYTPASATGVNVQGFGADVACAADGSVIVVGCIDATTLLYTGQPASQNVAFVFVYVRVNGVYTPLPGLNYVNAAIVPQIAYSSSQTGGGLMWHAQFVTPSSSSMNQSQLPLAVALSADGNFVALGEPNLASNPVVTSGTLLGTGFPEGAVISFALRQAYAYTLALEDEIGVKCDNDYNDLVLRWAQNPLFLLQASFTEGEQPGPFVYETVLDLLRLSSSNPVAVYLVFDDNLFTNVPSNTSWLAGWTYTASYEGAVVSTSPVVGLLTGGQLHGLGLPSTFTGKHALQLFANTTACIPSLFKANRAQYYANWTAAQQTPYAATVAISIPVALYEGVPPVAQQFPCAPVFGVTHGDGSIGYVTLSTLISDPSNPLAQQVAASTGTPALLKVIFDMTPQPTAPNGIFRPTQEFVPLLDVYDDVAVNVPALGTGDVLDLTNMVDDPTLVLPAVVASTSYAQATANWSFTDNQN